MMYKFSIRKVLRYLLLIIVCGIFFFPFVWMLLGSLKSSTEVMNSSTFWPSVWRFSNYVEAWNYAPFDIFFKNSIIQSILIVLFQIITSVLAAFAFAKLKFKLKKPLFMVFLATMMIPNEATIITNYLTVTKLGLMDTTLAVILPSMVSVFGIFLLRQNFMIIPDALIESARIDGAGDFRIFFSICLPIVKASVATLSIIGFIGAWNSYLWPMIVTNSLKMKNVQTGMRFVMGLDEALKPWHLLMAAATMLIVPVVILFLSMQRYYVEGIAKVGIK